MVLYIHQIHTTNLYCHIVITLAIVDGINARVKYSEMSWNAYSL